MVVAYDPITEHDAKPTQREVTIEWLPLIPILAVALLIRSLFVPDVLYPGDVEHLGVWVNKIREHGIFDFYQPAERIAPWDRVYPPFSTFAFYLIGLFTGGPGIETNPLFIALLKVVPICAELGLVAAAYIWFHERRKLQIVASLALAVHPGLLITSAWWAQYDAPFVLCLVLSLMALHRNKLLWAWLLFGAAVLFKQPAILMGPLLLILSLRRCGFRATMRGLVASIGLVAVATLPFALESGLANALSLYVNIGDVFPYVTNNAYNFWYASAFSQYGRPIPFANATYSDAGYVIGSLTYKTVGLVFFGAYVLMVLVMAWRKGRQPYEFVLATALYFAFFMLPTQVHERYLYPAAVFSLFAVAQDRRMWLVAGGLLVTYAYNLLGAAIPYRDRAPVDAFGVGLLALPTALANMALFAAATWMLLKRGRASSQEQPPPVQLDAPPAKPV